jgi:hypothetical protein
MAQNYPQQQQDPQITYQDPLAYIAWLRTRGLNPLQIQEAVYTRFGPGKTPEQRQREAESQQSNSQLSQVGGAVGGTVVAGEALRGFPNVRDLFKQPTYDPSGSIGITRQVPGQTLDLDALASGGTPNVVSIQGDTATVKLPNGKVDKLPTEALNDSTFMKSVNWDVVGTGALSALAAYQAYQSYKAGDKVGAGISGATAASLGASAAGQAGVQFAGQQTLAGAAPYLGMVAGGYQGYKTAEMLGNSAAGSQRTQQGALSGAASGALMGSSIDAATGGATLGLGTLIGGIVGGTAGAIGSWTGSSKGKAQFMRDNIRGVLKEGNILNDKYQGTLADGTLYDFGKDGSTLKWKEIDKVAAANPNAWNSTVPLTDALSAGYGFVGQKASDISAWYAKGAVSNAGDDANVAKANARHFAAQQGITYDSIKSKLDEAIKDSRISQTQYDYYLGGARDLTSGSTQAQGVRPPTPAKGQTVRVSPGMYMNDKGVITPATSKRAALDKYYTSSKEQSSKKGK